MSVTRPEQGLVFRMFSMLRPQEDWPSRRPLMRPLRAIFPRPLTGKGIFVRCDTFGASLGSAWMSQLADSGIVRRCIGGVGGERAGNAVRAGNAASAGNATSTGTWWAARLVGRVRAPQLVRRRASPRKCFRQRRAARLRACVAVCKRCRRQRAPWPAAGRAAWASKRCRRRLAPRRLACARAQIVEGLVNLSRGW